MDYKKVVKSIKDFLIGEVMTEQTDKEIASEVEEAKIRAAENTEDLIDDESEEGIDAEDLDEVEEINHEEIMTICEEKIGLCEDEELKNFFTGIKKFYDGASCEEAKKTIALQVNNKVFKLNN